MSNTTLTSDATQSFWIPRAWIDGTTRNRVRLTISHGCFTAVVADTEPDDNDIRLSGMAIPGAANCHSHTFHRALRGLGHEGATFWTWRDTMYRVASNLTPERYYRFAKAVYREMLLAGYTTVAEFHYVHHRIDGTRHDDSNAFGMALAAAARDAGIRMTLLDVCYLHADPQGSPLQGTQRMFDDGDVMAWEDRVTALAERVESDAAMARIRIGAAAHSVRACTLTEAQAVAEWSRHTSSDTMRPLHVHLSEQIAENKACMEATGLTPTALLDRAGFWGPNSTAVHATHLADDDIMTLGDSGTSISICPTTEADLADGIPQSADLQTAGARICVGSDENVCIDPFEEIRRLDGNQRLVSGQRDTFTPIELVDMLTANGQAAAGWPESGRLRNGCLADFIVLDDASPRTAGAAPDGVPLVASAADVTDVFVGGQHVVDNHRLTGTDDEPATDIADLVPILRGERA